MNAINGNKFESVADFLMTDINFSRYYNSLENNAEGRLGLGWSHSFSSRIIQTPDGEFTYRADDGSGDHYMKEGSRWVSTSGNGWIEEVFENGGKAFIRKPIKNPEINELYGSAGELRARRYANNLYKIEYTGGLKIYTGDAPPSIRRIEDKNGRSIEFHYNTDGLIDHISRDGVILVEFEYGPATLRGALTKVRYGSENGYEYKYEKMRLSAIYGNNGIKISSFTYNPNTGAAVSTERAGSTNSFEIYGPYTSWLDSNEYGVDVRKNNETVNKIGYRFINLRALPVSFTTSCGNNGGTHEIAYNDNGSVAASTNFLGSKVSYVRDKFNRINQTIETDQNGLVTRSKSTTWSEEGNIAGITTFDDTGAPLVNESREHDSVGHTILITTKDAKTSASRTTTIERCIAADTSGCADGEGIKSVDGARTDLVDKTKYAYYIESAPGCDTGESTCIYRRGDLRKIVNPLSQTTEYLAYDGAGRPLSIRDANGIVTDYTYHPRGWLTTTKVRGSDASSEADDRITRIDYWPTGLVKQVTQPDGAFTAFTYDAAHRLTDIADNAGNTVHYALDNAGNRIKEDTKDASGTLKRTLSRVYNQLGQLKTQANAASDPTDFEYDANGNATKVTDALATATQSEYDPLNRLSRTLQDVAGIKANTTLDYDALDNLTKVTDPKGLDTRYDYNGFGDLVKLTSPDTGVTSYTYDSAGNRATQTDARGNTTAYGYDALNRLTKVTYPTSSLNVTYTYDVTQTACASGETFSIGRLTKMQDGGAITQYCYNRFGDLVRKVQTSNGKALVLRYDYTVGGQLRRMTYPDGAVVDYVRNAQGQTTEVGVTPAGGSRQVLLGNASYYPFGPTAGWTYGNGRALARRYDLDYRPQAIQDTRPGGLEVGFGFDPAGNLTALTPAGNPTPEIGLGYDTLGRLTGLKDGSTGTLIDGYSYDATGNRLSAKVGTATQAYTYPTDSHRLSAVAGVARSYDAAGNTTAIGGTARQYTYDTTGRMTQARRAGAVTMNYRYNGRGEQVRRFLGTTNTYTLYDEAGHWLGDYDTNGAPKQQAIWLDDLPVGLLANASKLHYIEPDHLGSPRVVIDPIRDVAVWTWSLKGEAFGNTAPNQDPDGDGAALVLDMRFPGQRFDAASGLNQNYFRDYEAATGRYGQSDPIGLDGGSTTYSYTGSSPLMWKDTNGLVRWSGNAMPAAVGVGALSVGAYVFDLTSQCVNGRKAHVLVRAWGAGFGAGLKYLPVTSTAGNVTLEDQLPDIVPSNLVGLFFMENAGVSVGGFGGGCNAYQMGSEWTPAVSKNGTSCSLGGGGLDAGIGLQWGKSELVGLKWLKCDECSPVETPF
ncbi:RHS repeat-associated core domain-containing protein [Xanthomonas campestris]|uniref:RHS repeat-associated core domain-containing protein n=2 Tax=Xanthomonas campestris TaxID=339 RepID=UPI003557CD60